MNETKLHITRDVSNGQGTTESNSERPSTNGTQRIEKSITQKSEVVVMNETQLELSDEQLNKLKTESLDSMKVSRKCANQLLNLLQTCVNDKDIESAMSGDSKTEVYRLDMAVKFGNAIAGQLQAQNNLLKSLALFTKNK